MKPLLNNVLIKPDPTPEKTDEGVHIPDSAQRVSDRGTVIAVGPGMRNNAGEYVPIPLEKGDRVMFAAQNTPGISINDELHILLREHQILTVLEEGDEQKKPKAESLKIVKK